MNIIRWSIAKIAGHALQRLFTMILRKLQVIARTANLVKKSGAKSAGQPTPTGKKRTVRITGSAKLMQDPHGLLPAILMKSGVGMKRPKGRASKTG